MPNLRFKATIDNRRNSLDAFFAVQDSKNFPFVNKEIISIALQFMIIEPGSFVYGVNEAIWTGELFPIGKYVKEAAVMLVQVSRMSDNNVYTLAVDADRDNKLIAHLTAEDGSTFPFTENETVMIQVYIADIQQGARYDFGNPNLSIWTLSLIPVGKIVNDTIVCEVERG